MKASIFESRKAEAEDKRLRIVLPISLFEDIATIEKTLAERAPDKRFNTDAICVAALKRAVNKAKRELAAL